MSISRTLNPYRRLPRVISDKAECQRSSLDFVEPPTAVDEHMCKRYCATCPVITECLQWALDNKEETGIWGGTNDRERRKIRRGKTTKRRETADDSDLITGETQAA